jgi:hypothetical protein
LRRSSAWVDNVLKEGIILKKVIGIITMLILFVAFSIVTGASSFADELDEHPELDGKIVKAHDGGTAIIEKGNDTTPKDWSKWWGDTVNNDNAQNTSIIVMINGITVAFPDTQPYIDSNSRTMVPIRFVAENLGSKVSWDEKSKTVTITKNSKIICLVIDSRSYIINSNSMLMDTVPAIKEGRTMVPLRFVGEVLGVQTKWEAEIRTVNILMDSDYN